MSEPIEAVLSRIDSQYSQRYHLGMLKFLAQSVVKHGQLENCNSVLEVYKKLETKCSNSRIAAALLRHMLRATGYENEAELQSLSKHCANEFDLKTVAPSLPFYELLLILAKKLHKNNNYKRFLHSINDDRLDKSKHDVSSPIDMLQSMIHKNTITPDDLNTLHTLVTLLNDLEMLEEAKFLKQSVSQPCIAGCDGQRSVTLFSYFNFEGQLQQFSSQVEHSSESSLQQVTSKTIEAVWTDQELRPLLNPEVTFDGNIHEEKNCCKVYCKLWVLACGAIMLLCLSGFAMFLYFGTAPDHLEQTQSIYGNIVYSPFSKFNIDHRYNHIEATLDYSEPRNNYNLTICQATCPLKTHTKQLVYNGTCKVRSHTNCRVKFSNSNTHPDYDFSQCFVIYMVKNSKVSFKITDLNVTESVHLCITAKIEKCDSIFWPGGQKQSELKRACVKLETYNLTNHDVIETFTVPYDSYYCAIWLLGSSDQWINYTVTASIQTYNITDYSPHLCRSYVSNYEQHSHVTFPLHSSSQQTMCILQQNTVELLYPNCYNTTINSIALKPLNNGIWIAFSVIMGLFCLAFFIVIILIILYHYYG